MLFYDLKMTMIYGKALPQNYTYRVSIQYGLSHVFKDYHDKHFTTVTAFIKFLSSITSFMYLEVTVTNKGFTMLITIELLFGIGFSCF